MSPLMLTVASSSLRTTSTGREPRESCRFNGNGRASRCMVISFRSCALAGVTSGGSFGLIVKELTQLGVTVQIGRAVFPAQAIVEDTRKVKPRKDGVMQRRLDVDFT